MVALYETRQKAEARQRLREVVARSAEMLRGGLRDFLACSGCYFLDAALWLASVDDWDNPSCCHMSESEIRRLLASRPGWILNTCTTVLLVSSGTWYGEFLFLSEKSDSQRARTLVTYKVPRLTRAIAISSQSEDLQILEFYQQPVPVTVRPANPFCLP